MNIIKKLLEDIDIVEIIGQFVDLKKSGQCYVGLCPFHKEKTPSFMVSKKRKCFKCLSCGLEGNVIDFIVYYNADSEKPLDNCETFDNYIAACEYLLEHCKI